ncbi:MAG TPA: 50S ribosomal protein L16 [Candidatus Paceibacterota bacterium]|jgi:large subunit ribosomal protein L16|nr:50S ribosomal protein L16 [Candidatus Paceibacterota bacterium]HPX52539.1 50S ribosomal protein L16 [Candidatus Paceibacterota bacterium]HQB57234.1 50S ribosomal protein L16 [Candidatus Paceibacterota bacterium]
MLFPKKVKHRKWQSARSSLEKAARPETKGINVDFGSFGLKAQTDKRITSNQIEAARRAMVRYGGKTAKFWIRVFPDRPYTQKGAEVPMGKGKGDPKGYCVEVRPGRILFEIDGVSEAVAREALRKAGTKLPIKTKVVARV